MNATPDLVGLSPRDQAFIVRKATVRAGLRDISSKEAEAWAREHPHEIRVAKVLYFKQCIGSFPDPEELLP